MASRCRGCNSTMWLSIRRAGQIVNQCVEYVAGVRVAAHPRPALQTCPATRSRCASLHTRIRLVKLRSCHGVIVRVRSSSVACGGISTQRVTALGESARAPRHIRCSNWYTKEPYRLVHWAPQERPWRKTQAPLSQNTTRNSLTRGGSENARERQQRISRRVTAWDTA